MKSSTGSIPAASALVAEGFGLLIVFCEAWSGGWLSMMDLGLDLLV